MRNRILNTVLSIALAVVAGASAAWAQVSIDLRQPGSVYEMQKCKLAKSINTNDEQAGASMTAWALEYPTDDPADWNCSDLSTSQLACMLSAEISDASDPYQIQAADAWSQLFGGTPDPQTNYCGPAGDEIQTIAGLHLICLLYVDGMYTTSCHRDWGMCTYYRHPNALIWATGWDSFCDTRLNNCLHQSATSARLYCFLI